VWSNQTFHQRDDGGFVIGEPTSASQNDAHIARSRGRPNIFPMQELAQQHVSRMLAKTKKTLPRIAQATQGDHRCLLSIWRSCTVVFP
jgi:hypothetical protein